MADSRTTATRVTRGGISLSSSSHFAAKLYSNTIKPVALPPGRVAAVEPAQLREPLEERRYAGLKLRIVSGAGHQHADTPYALALRRARRERPCCRRAAEKRDEVAPIHSITSSARASRVGGTSRPIVLA